MNTKTKIRSLIYAANDKTGKGDTDLTTAVQSLISKTGGITPSGNKALTPSETAQTGIDVTNFATVSVDAIPSTYVGSGVTKKAAATVAPSTSEQTVCASGVYTTGEQKVSAITPSIVGNLDASSFAASIVAAIEGKGVTVPDGTLLDGMAALINSIEAGGGGGFQVALGTFTPAETKALNSLPPLSIEHNAGFTPDVFIFYKTDVSTYDMIAISAIGRILWGGSSSRYCCYVMCKGVSGMGEGNLASYPLTGEVAYIRSNITNHKVTAGQEYRWIAIGGI